MCHGMDYKSSKTNFLEVPSFKEIISSVTKSSLGTKEMSEDKSYSLMRDLHKKKEYLVRKPPLKKVSSRVQSSRPKASYRSKFLLYSRLFEEIHN